MRYQSGREMTFIQKDFMNDDLSGLSQTACTRLSVITAPFHLLHQPFFDSKKDYHLNASI